MRLTPLAASLPATVPFVARAPEEVVDAAAPRRRWRP